MKKVSKRAPVKPDELRPEYRLDYAKAKPNRFAGRSRTQRLVVALDPDVAKIFKDEESVNAVLRSIVKALPRKTVLS
jgi:hypothetical protein